MQKMLGRGRRWNGIGRGGVVRHSITRGTINSVSKIAIHRIACRGGIKHLGGLVYEETWYSQDLPRKCYL